MKVFSGLEQIYILCVLNKRKSDIFRYCLNKKEEEEEEESKRKKQSGFAASSFKIISNMAKKKKASWFSDRTTFFFVAQSEWHMYFSSSVSRLMLYISE